MSHSNVRQHDELVLLCIDAVRSKIMTTFENIGQRDADISLIRSTVEPHIIPACIKIVLEPKTRCWVAPGECIPPGAHEVGSEDEAQSLISDHVVASPNDYRAAGRHLRDTFPGDGLAVGSRSTPLPESLSSLIVAFATECAGCGGQTRICCPQCDGQRAVTCWTCGGCGQTVIEERNWVEDMIPGDATGSGRTGRYETITRRVGCGTCGCSGRAHCPTCNATGVVVCEPCGGTGLVTFCKSLTYDIATTIEWPSTETHGKLQEWLENQDLDELVRANAQTDLLTEGPRPESHGRMRYNVTVPFGTMAFRFAEDQEDHVLVVAGRAGDIVLEEGFLGAISAPLRETHAMGTKLSCAEALAVLADAVRDPAVKIVSTQALPRPDTEYDEVVNEVRR